MLHKHLAEIGRLVFTKPKAPSGAADGHLADRIQAEFYYFSDIDHFKEINDTFGHSTGDQVLLELAEILKRSFRESDIIARIGGGEFAVALTDCNKETLDLVKIHLKENINDHNQDIKPASYRAWPGRCFL